MATVRDCVTDALRELGVLAAGEVASADDEIAGLAALNRLVDAWAAERLQIFTNSRTLFTITSGLADYEVGPTASPGAVMPFPMFVENCNYLDSSISPSLEYQLQPLTNAAWARVPIKTLQSPRPTCYYWNATFPLGTLTLWPVPTATTLQGVLYSPTQVAEFTGLSQAISLPPGYRRMIVKNLALELSPSYERPASPELRQQAMESVSVVKRSNIQLMDMQIELAALVQGRGSRYVYSIFSGS
jgi:hypothetical protein